MMTKGGAFSFFYCHTTSHRLKGLGQCVFVIPWFPWVRVQCNLTGSFSQGLTRLRCQWDVVLSGPRFQAHWGFQHNSAPSTVEPTFLLAVARVLVCGGPLSKHGSFSLCPPGWHPSSTFAILWPEASHRGTRLHSSSGVVWMCSN